MLNKCFLSGKHMGSLSDWLLLSGRKTALAHAASNPQPANQRGPCVLILREERQGDGDGPRSPSWVRLTPEISKSLVSHPAGESEDSAGPCPPWTSLAPPSGPGREDRRPLLPFRACGQTEAGPLPTRGVGLQGPHPPHSQPRPFPADHGVSVPRSSFLWAGGSGLAHGKIQGLSFLL